MLLELKIKNLAIIESSEVHFGKGLNVITGETGAGKSILLEALNLIFGGRSDRELIRTEKEEAQVEAVFDLLPSVRSFLDEWGIVSDLSEPLVLRRVIHVSGRSRGFINASSVSAQQLKQLASLLVDFGRQHEQGLLMDAQKHIELLDQYADAAKDGQSVEKQFRQTRKWIQEYEKLKAEESSWRDRTEFLKFQKKNIRDIDPQAGEEDELAEELEKLGDIETCQKLAQRAEAELYRNEDSIQSRLSSTISVIEEISEVDDSVNDVLEDLHNALISIEEAARSMANYQKTLSRDPGAMEDIQERLDQIIELQERYGGSFESVMEKLQEIDEEIAELALKQKRLEELTGILAEGKRKLLKLALGLSQKRKKNAAKLTGLIETELHGLALEKARFEIRFAPVEENDGLAVLCTSEADNSAGKEPAKEYAVQSWGIENVFFLFSANQGEELRPLEKVASGGELSRIMLALKRIIGSTFSVPTFIFDEIDSGISGTAATMVAQKLRQIVSSPGQDLQAICISHTAQVAAEADIHLKSAKQVKDNRTSARVSILNHDERVQEISRILAGDQSPEHALALAQELLVTK